MLKIFALKTSFIQTINHKKVQITSIIMEHCNRKIKNSFFIDVYARRIITIHTEEELLYFFRKFSSEKEPILILGQGTNVLFLENYSGTVLFNRISGVSVREKSKFWHLHVGAGEIWHNLVKTCLKNQMPGLENLAFIPGCVGSAPIQNIGAYGIELKQLCTYVDIIHLKSGKKSRVSAKDCQFGYRNSIFIKKKFQRNYAIIAVGLKIPKLWKPILNHQDLFYLNPKKVSSWEIYHCIRNIRKKKLPNHTTGNAGSFFKNPIVDVTKILSLKTQYPKIPFQFYNHKKVKLKAVWLIEKCGLKGYRWNQAAVYEKQSLILINIGNATGNDIANLAKYVHKKVLQKFNIYLESEVHCIKAFGKFNFLQKRNEISSIFNSNRKSLK